MFDGRSAAYSGSGFSDMHFTRHRHVARAHLMHGSSAPAHRAARLTEQTYRKLEQPSSKGPVTLYAQVDPRLFQGVVDQYTASNGDICRADSPVTISAIAGANMPPLPAQRQTLER